MERPPRTLLLPSLVLFFAGAAGAGTCATLTWHVVRMAGGLPMDAWGLLFVLAIVVTGGTAVACLDWFARLSGTSTPVRLATGGWALGLTSFGLATTQGRLFHLFRWEEDPGFLALVLAVPVLALYVRLSDGAADEWLQGRTPREASPLTAHPAFLLAVLGTGFLLYVVGLFYFAEPGPGRPPTLPLAGFLLLAVVVATWAAFLQVATRSPRADAATTLAVAAWAVFWGAVTAYWLLTPQEAYASQLPEFAAGALFLFFAGWCVRRLRR